MSTIDERRERASTGVALHDEEAWRDGFARPRVFLQPIAAPSALGLAGFSVATLMVALIQAGWLGHWSDIGVVGLFAMTFGGFAQFAAGMWSYRARDVVATLAHGMWGSFWLAFGLVQIFILAGKIPEPVPGEANYLTAATKRTVLPTGHFKKDRNIPGRQPLETVELPWAEPGIKQGQ